MTSKRLSDVKKLNQTIRDLSYLQKNSLEYFKALSAVISTRVQRQRIYGDDWTESPIDHEIWLIFEKFNRMMNLFKSKNTNSYEKLEDTVRDLVNYGLFLLAKLTKEAKK